MTRMHLMWFCAFSPHAGFGLNGWAGPRTTGYEWTRPELWQDMAVALERAKFDLIMLGDSLAVPGTYQGRMDACIDSKPYIGTPERVADELARTIDAVGGDGFALRQGIWPGYVGPFVDKVIPLLQQRGAVRTEYTGTTLREHLREF